MDDFASKEIETYLHDLRRDRAAAFIAILHVAFEINVEELKYEVQLLIRMNDVEKPVMTTKRVIFSDRASLQD